MKAPTSLALCLLLSLGTVESVTAATSTWTGAGPGNSWGTAANWGGTAPVAGNDLVFSGTTNLATQNNFFTSGTAFGSVSFDSSAGAFSLSGNQIRFTSITDNSTSTETIGLFLSMSATRTVSVATGGNLVLGGTISGTGFGLTKSGTAGSGTLTLSGANSYTGTTTLSAGTTYVNYTPAVGSGSGTGTGAVAVNNGATLGGNGTIKPTAGTGVTIATGATLSSGAVQTSDATHDTVTGSGLTLDNSANLSKILTVNSGSTLTFNLGAGTTGGSGFLSFATPNTNSTFLKVTGNTGGEIAFGTGSAINIKLVDLTAFSGTDTLQLRFQNPYLLIQAGADADYTNLVTTGGLNADGYVLGVGTLASYTPFNISATDINGAALTYPYNNLQLYLYNGNLEIIPEPGTWALLLGGLVSLLVWQRRRTC